MNVHKQNAASLDSTIHTSGVYPSDSRALSSADLDVSYQGSCQSEPQCSTNKSPTGLLPNDFLDAEPSAEDEIFLSEVHPGLSEMMSRLKVVASICGVSHDFMEPILEQLHITGQLCDDVRDQADAVAERAEPVVAYFNETAKKLEEELTSLLGGLGMGLPSESWHEDAIMAVIKDRKREKLKLKKS